MNKYGSIYVGLRDEVFLGISCVSSLLSMYSCAQTNTKILIYGRNELTARGMKLRYLCFLSSMSLVLRLFQRNRKPGAHQSSLENDGLGAPAYTSNVRSAPAHTLPGRDSVMLSDETESQTSTSSPTGPSQLASPNYSKRPSGNQFFSLLI